MSSNTPKRETVSRSPGRDLKKKSMIKREMNRFSNNTGGGREKVFGGAGNLWQNLYYISNVETEKGKELGGAAMFESWGPRSKGSCSANRTKKKSISYFKRKRSEKERRSRREN